jgi:hypothetical protein
MSVFFFTASSRPRLGRRLRRRPGRRWWRLALESIKHLKIRIPLFGFFI